MSLSRNPGLKYMPSTLCASHSVTGTWPTMCLAFLQKVQLLTLTRCEVTCKHVCICPLNYSTCNCALQAAAVQLSAFMHDKACNDAYRPRGTITLYVLMLYDELDECLLLQSGHGGCYCTLLLLHTAIMANKARQGLNNAVLCLIKLMCGITGLQVAIIGMGASAWEARNAASLIFTALLIRMLGFRNLVKVCNLVPYHAWCICPCLCVACCPLPFAPALVSASALAFALVHAFVLAYGLPLPMSSPLLLPFCCRCLCPCLCS